MKLSQTNKDKYMILLTCGILENDISKLIYKTETDSDLENKLMVTNGKMWWRRNNKGDWD